MLDLFTALDVAAVSNPSVKLGIGSVPRSQGPIPNRTIERCRLASFPASVILIRDDQEPNTLHEHPRAPRMISKAAAEDGWKRMLDWFRKYGVA